jgi:hypothetical protein
MLKIISIIQSHGAECAFPTSTIHLAQDAGAGDTQVQQKIASQ